MPKPFHTVLSCAPPMYDELWVAGKCMYKLEPVVADGGELIIYAPHMHEISVTHGHAHRARSATTAATTSPSSGTGSSTTRGASLAHSTHVRGGGTFENGVEKLPRAGHARFADPAGGLRAINLGYRDPATIDVESFANREDEGVLLVRKAGEQLYRLNEPEGSTSPQRIAP